jgi:hypothetical protein
MRWRLVTKYVGESTIMSEETNKPEQISDEQLEDVAGGTMDTTITTENCSAMLSSNINL